MTNKISCAEGRTAHRWLSDPNETTRASVATKVQPEVGVHFREWSACRHCAAVRLLEVKYVAGRGHPLRSTVVLPRLPQSVILGSHTVFDSID